MARTLYSPKLSDDVVRLLYRKGQRRRMPPPPLADLILRKSLGGEANIALLPDHRPPAVAEKPVA